MGSRGTFVNANQTVASYVTSISGSSSSLGYVQILCIVSKFSMIWFQPSLPLSTLTHDSGKLDFTLSSLPVFLSGCSLHLKYLPSLVPALILLAPTYPLRTHFPKKAVWKPVAPLAPALLEPLLTYTLVSSASSYPCLLTFFPLVFIDWNETSSKGLK